MPMQNLLELDPQIIIQISEEYLAKKLVQLNNNNLVNYFIIQIKYNNS